MPDFTHMLDKTDVWSIPRSKLAQTVVGMAHFAGTGPDGESCAKCVFFVRPEGKQKHICAKYAQLTGDRRKTLSGDEEACRYFDKRPA